MNLSSKVVFLPRFLLFLFLIVFFSPTVKVFAEVEITLKGLEKELHSILVAALDPPAALKAPGPVNRMWFERYLNQLPQKIRTNLEPYGYFHSEASFQQEAQGEKILLTVIVTPGPAVRLVERTITLVEETPDRPVLDLESFPLAVGDAVREDLYEKGKAELLSRVRDQGFLEARYLRHQLRIDREKNQAWILLEISAGVRSRFGPVTIRGGDDYPERYLRRFLTFEQGAPFSYSLLGQTQKQLRNSDRFLNVLVAPRPEDRQGAEVPIDIELKARKRYSLRPGLGYGTDTGVRGSLRFHDLNTWQRGHDFNLDLLVAQRMQNFTGRYSFPGYRDLDTGLNIHGGYRAEQVDSYETRYVFTEVEQTYGFPGDRVGAIFARAQFENSDISADSVYTGFLMPGIRYNEVQLPESTGKGYGFHIQGEARFTDRNLLSDISLTQLLGNGDLLLSLPWRMSMTTRFQIAGTLVDDPFIEVPASLRFFAGGDRSVRGYAYQSLGPKDEEGQVVGGKHLLSGSFELGKQIGEKWGLALFLDGGNAFDSWNDYALAFGAGVGFRYSTPVGPLQVDLASPVAEGKGSLRLHIGIGFGW